MQERLDANSGEAPVVGGRASNALGDPIRVFRAGLAIRLTVAVCGLILLGGAVWLLLAMGALGPGTWVLPFSLVILALAYFMGKSSYHICSGGVIQERFGHRQYCRWEDVLEIVDRRRKQGQVSSRSCILLNKNGARLELRELFANDFGALLTLIRQQAEARGIPWKEERDTPRGKSSEQT